MGRRPPRGVAPRAGAAPNNLTANLQSDHDAGAGLSAAPWVKTFVSAVKLHERPRFPAAHACSAAALITLGSQQLTTFAFLHQHLLTLPSCVQQRQQHAQPVCHYRFPFADSQSKQRLRQRRSFETAVLNLLGQIQDVPTRRGQGGAEASHFCSRHPRPREVLQWLTPREARCQRSGLQTDSAQRPRVAIAEQPSQGVCCSS